MLKPVKIFNLFDTVHFVKKKTAPNGKMEKWGFRKLEYRNYCFGVLKKDGLVKSASIALRGNP